MHAKPQFTPPELSPNYILAKLDIQNAFNSMRRDILHRKCLINCPEIFRLASLAFGSPTPLVANGKLIWSDSDVQQGDPLGPLIFSLAIHDITSFMKSNFYVLYLDDATIAGDPRSVCDDIKKCSCMLADIGLFLYPSKSDLVNPSLDETVFLRETQCLNSLLDNVSFAKKEDVMLLGSPLASTAIRPQFQHKLSIFKAMTEKLSLLIDSQLTSFKKLLFNAITNVPAAKLTYISISRSSCRLWWLPQVLCHRYLQCFIWWHWLDSGNPSN